MTVYRFRATPLTPIHIGSGDALAPEDYTLDGDHLQHFNRAAVLASMSVDERGRLVELIDKARNWQDVANAQTLLRKHVHAEHVLARIAIGDESRQELQTVIASTDADAVARKREMRSFITNPVSGQPYLPGSSLKGAIRTAVVNALTRSANDSSLIDPAIAQRVAQESDKKRKWRTLESAALQLDERHLVDGDPFRLIKVADAALPVDATRIDKVEMLKASGDVTTSIQMHFERLLSRADGEDSAPHFDVRLEIDERIAKKKEVREKLHRIIEWPMLRDACNAFYWRRMNAELDRFFPRNSEKWDLSYKRVKIGLARRGADGKLMIAPPPWEDRILLRVGRFSHFESLSVDDLRQGWNIQKKSPITEGATRMVCRTRPGTAGTAVLAPFGWLLLERIADD